MGRHLERGTTMVETALVLGALLIVLFGIMYFGRAMYTYHLVDNAARLGTRFAAVRGSQCQHYKTGVGQDPWPCNASSAEIANYVSQQSTLMGLGPIPTNDVATTWQTVQGCQSPPNGTGCQVTVTVNYPYQWLMPFMPSTTISMSSSSEMVISQ